ncbi:MAG: hypothetical protein LQ349_004748 [Xanthoria aureola]|nr:MAG: hypothetical protein LQ349_004748 [Xanthoria aureola]
MSRKRRQDNELIDITRAKFAKTVRAGTFMEFLIQDANVTRKAFMRWWIEDYLKSSHGKALPKAVKTEIKGLIEARPPNPISRESLLPGTVSVIQTWESIPLVPGSVEWAKARVRLIRDVIFDGRFKEYQDHFDLDATPEEIAHARCWMHQREDGQLDYYRSLAQLWSYKDIEWSNEGPVTKLADPTLTAVEFPPVPANPLSNPNRLRISVDDFELHLSVLTISSREEQQQQPPQQPPQQHTAETSTADASKRAMEPSMEVVFQQQQRVKEEHAPKGIIDGVITGQSRVKEEHARGKNVEVDSPHIKNEPGEQEDDEIEIIQQLQIKNERGEDDAEVEIIWPPHVKNERGEDDAEVEIIWPPHVKNEHAPKEVVDGVITKQPRVKEEHAPEADVKATGAATQQPQIQKERVEEEAGDSDVEIIAPPPIKEKHAHHNGDTDLAIIIEPPPSITKAHAPHDDGEVDRATTTQQQPHVKKEQEHARQDDGEVDRAATQQKSQIKKEEHAREAEEVEVEVHGGIIQQPHIKTEPARQEEIEVDGATTQQPRIKKERMEAEDREGDSDLEIIESLEYHD